MGRGREWRKWKEGIEEMERGKEAGRKGKGMCMLHQTAAVTWSQVRSCEVM